MATQAQPELVTPEEYLASEREAETKSEYVDGVIYAMSGASIPHNILVANLIAILLPPMRKKGCQIFPSDLKVRVGKRFYYPGVSAICGEPIYHDGEKDVVLNPSLLIEVLSASTRGYNKGKKFLAYQQIASLQDYLLVHQEQALVERYRRQDDTTWLYTRVEGIESGIHVLGCTLSLADLYSNVKLQPDD